MAPWTVYGGGDFLGIGEYGTVARDVCISTAFDPTGWILYDR
jgi:hypothetical protein